MQNQKALALPHVDEATGAHFVQLSSVFLAMRIPSGIELSWDGNHRIYIKLDPSFKNKARLVF